MKICLAYLNQNNGEIFPVGLISIATTLKRNFPHHEVEIADINFEDPFQRIDTGKYDLLGISAMTIEYEKATFLARSVKEKIGIPVIIGGVHISTLPESLRECFDIGVIGEGEEVFCQLVELYEKGRRFSPSDLAQVQGIVYKEAEELKITQRRPLAEPLDNLIPQLDYSFVNKEYFRHRALVPWSEFGREAIILTSRGCPYKCIFCSTTQFWNKVRCFSVERFVGEVKNLVENYKIDHIQVFDDLFTLNKVRLKAIAEAIRKEGLHLKVKLACQSRANLIDDELCKILKSINVRIVSFGFESGNERVLKMLKAGSVSVEQNKKAIETCVKHGLKVCGSFIFGSPSETIKEMWDTVRFIDYTKKAGADRVWCFVMTPFPSTKVWDIAKSRGKVSDDMNFDDLNHQSIDSPIMLEEGIAVNDFKDVFFAARKSLHYYKWKKLFSMMRNEPLGTISLVLSSPWEHLKRGFCSKKE